MTELLFITMAVVTAVVACFTSLWAFAAWEEEESTEFLTFICFTTAFVTASVALGVTAGLALAEGVAP